MTQNNNLNDIAFTSSLSDYFLCNWCGDKFKKRVEISNHMDTCNEYKKTLNVKGGIDYLRCKICNQDFGNRGGLMSHVARRHTIQPLQKSARGHIKCDACERVYCTPTGLRLHIRRDHFNLQGKIPYCHQKKVNQVWFEKVMNCNNVIEIKKTAPNTLVMRKLDEKSAIKVYDNNVGFVDVSDIYPTY